MTRNRTRARRGEARGRIVSAAVEAFAEKGFEAASTRDVAQRARTDQGLLPRAGGQQQRRASFHVPGLNRAAMPEQQRKHGDWVPRLIRSGHCIYLQ